MEQNKLETDFRDKLNQRQIQPSLNSWDRLDAMLTIAEEKRPKQTNNWLYVAATIIGFIFIGAVFFSQTEELVDVKKNNVVQENNFIDKPDEITIPNKVNIVAPNIVKKENNVAVSKTNIKNNNQKVSEKERVSIINQQNNLNQIAEKEPNKSDNQTTNNDILNEEERITETNPINDENSKNDIDKTSIKVDANTLLSQVDGELSLSFREKVIKKVNKNYKSVKVAVINRNNQ